MRVVLFENDLILRHKGLKYVPHKWNRYFIYHFKQFNVYNVYVYSKYTQMFLN